VLTKSHILNIQKNGFIIPDFKMFENDLLEIEDKHNQLIKKHLEYKNYYLALLFQDESFLKYCLNQKDT
jgi:hypothetical protein